MEELPSLVADEVGRKLEDFNFHQTSTFSKDDLKDVMRQLLQEYGVARATPAPGTAAVVDLTKVTNRYMWNKRYDDWNAKSRRSTGEGFHLLPWGYKLPRTVSLSNAIDLWENGSYIRDDQNKIVSRITALKYVQPSNFSHRAERILYSRWKFVFKHLENLVPEGRTLKESYMEHILPHLRESFTAKKYAIDVLSYQVASLYAKRKDWVKEASSN